MKLKIFYLYKIVTFILVNIFILINNFIYADYKKIKIYSAYQSIDIINNIINFKKNVILQYKNIKLCANEITISYNKYNCSSLIAYGYPVTVNWLYKSIYSISAQSKIVNYDAINNILTLIENAYIKQLNHSIYSDKITYFINQNKIEAISNKNSKTIMILSIHPI